MRRLAWIFFAAGMLATLARPQAVGLPGGTPYQYANTIRNGIGAPSNALGNDGDFYIDTQAVKMYGPKLHGVWGTGTSLVGSGTGGGNMVYPPSGIPQSSGSAWLSSLTAPLSAFVGATDTQTLTNKSIDASEINSGVFASARIPTINLASGITGNLPIANLNGGTSASASTFWRGDGTWATPAGTGGGLNDPGSNGVVERTSLNNTTAVPAPTGTIVGTSDTQTLTNKSIAASEINSGTLSTSVLPAFTGDVTSPAGSSVNTLATVNSNVGTFGDSTHTVQATVDAKGRITAISQLAVSGSGGSMVYPPAGVSVSSGTGWSASLTSPSSALVGISDSQTLTNKSIAASEVNSGTLSSSVVPAANLASSSNGGVTGNLPVTNLNGGTAASSSTFWRGDGTWATPNTGNVSTTGNLVTGNVPKATGTATLADGGQAYPGSAFVGISDSQTLTNKSIAASEVNSGTFAAAQLPAFTGDVTSPSGSSVNTLATVNSTPGTYGSATESVQITVDGKGRITSITQIAITGGGGGGGTGTATAITAGLTAALPATCTTGAVYFATDQPAGQQVYNCSATNTWTQTLSLGGSGALAFTNGSLDVTNQVPMIGNANAFTGQNSFAGGTLIPPVLFSALPTCGSGTNAGLHRGISDSNTQTWGATVSVGGGSLPAGLYCDGSSWTVESK